MATPSIEKADKLNIIGHYYCHFEPFKCHIHNFETDEHEAFLVHLANDRAIALEQRDLSPEVLTKKFPRLWKSFCRFRDNRKAYLYKPLINNQHYVVKVEMRDDFVKYIHDGCEFTSVRPANRTVIIAEAILPSFLSTTKIWIIKIENKEELIKECVEKYIEMYGDLPKPIFEPERQSSRKTI